MIEAITDAAIEAARSLEQLRSASARVTRAVREVVGDLPRFELREVSCRGTYPTPVKLRRVPLDRVRGVVLLGASDPTAPTVPPAFTAVQWRGSDDASGRLLLTGVTGLTPGVVDYTLRLLIVGER